MKKFIRVISFILLLAIIFIVSYYFGNEIGNRWIAESVINP